MSSPVAVIVDAVRTPIGKRNGRLAGWHPAELLGEVLASLAARSALEPTLVDDVIAGCVTQVGAQSTNIGRSAVLAANWPASIPGTTVDRQCGSSQQAIAFAAQAIRSGDCDVVIAAGVEMMSVVPMFSNSQANLGDPFGSVVRARYQDRTADGSAGLMSQGLAAEIVARRWGLNRSELDELSLESHRRAAAARDEGRFEAEIVPVVAKTRDRETGEVNEDGWLKQDECIRSTSMEQLSALKPVFVDDGEITAGNSSQISDGAAAVLVMSAAAAERLGLRPLASIRASVVVGDDPLDMLTAPIPATRKLIERSQLDLAEIERFEMNEAFSSVPLAWARELDIELSRVNVNGGAIALGHPLGASGARLMTTLVHELDRSQSRFGMQVMCELGGLANAMLIERWS